MANTTPLYAVVGVTDLAVQRVRAAVAEASGLQAQFESRVSAVQADVEKRVTEFDPQLLRAQVQDVPNKAAAFALETASKATVQVETVYDGLAKRGQALVERIRSQQTTQDFVAQANSTVGRGRAAVTTARKAADDTRSALLGTITTGRREVTTVVDDTQAEVGTAVRQTRTAAKKSATTTRKKAAATKSAVKGVQTSAGKTAASGRTAAKAAAKKVGD